MSEAAIALLEAQAASFGASVTAVDRSSLAFTLNLTRSDHRSSAYELLAKTKGSAVKVREAVPSRLPAFCPERHINDGGGFCLGLESVDDLEVRDEGSAGDWWARLLKFLSLQERATQLRRWPDLHVWPHGHAADHQHRAEQAAQVLGPPFTDDLISGRLTVVRTRRGAGGHGLQVRRDGRRLYAVWQDTRQPVNLRRRCICRNGLDRPPSILRSCKNHAAKAVELAFALRDRDLAERAYWASWRGRQCCGSLDGCPLAGAPRDLALPSETAEQR